MTRLPRRIPAWGALALAAATALADAPAGPMTDAALAERMRGFAERAGSLRDEARRAWEECRRGEPDEARACRARWRAACMRIAAREARGDPPEGSDLQGREEARRALSRTQRGADTLRNLRAARERADALVWEMDTACRIAVTDRRDIAASLARIESDTAALRAQADDLAARRAPLGDPDPAWPQRRLQVGHIDSLLEEARAAVERAGKDREALLDAASEMSGGDSTDDPASRLLQAADEAARVGRQVRDARDAIARWEASIASLRDRAVVRQAAGTAMRRAYDWPGSPPRDEPCAPGTLLLPGDGVWTGDDGSAAIELEDGSSLVLGPRAAIQLPPEPAGDDPGDAEILSGDVERVR